MASGVDTHTHTYFGGMKVILRNQACAWLKKTVLIKIANATLKLHNTLITAKQITSNIPVLEIRI